MTNLGLLGSGIIAEFHMFGVERIADARISAIASVDEISGRQMAEKCGATYYLHYRDLLENEKGLDGIIVALPNHMHFEACTAAISMGFKAILCEKPLCTNPQDSEKLVRQVQQENVLFQTGYMKRFNPGFQTIKDDLLSLGEIEFVDFSIFQSSPEPQQTRSAALTSWHKDAKLSGGGFLTHSGSHHIDLLRYYFGEVTSVAAKCRYDSTDGRDYYVTGSLKTESNTDVSLRLGRSDIPNLGPDWKVVRGGWNESVEVVGTKGYVKVTNPTWQGYEAMEVKRWVKGMVGPETHFRECSDQWIAEIAAFCLGCTSGKLDSRASTVTDGYRVDQIIQKIRESSDEGGAEIVLDGTK